MAACDKAFPVEKFVYLELSGIGKGAIGQEAEAGGCSSHTRPMLIEAEGATEEEQENNFAYLKEQLEQALAAKAAERVP